MENKSARKTRQPPGTAAHGESLRKVALPIFYLGLGFTSGFIWTRIAFLPDLPEWHLQMVSGAAPAPNQYRPLTPWIAEALLRLFPGLHVVTVYLLIRSVATGVALRLFDRYMRTWFAPVAATAGTLCLAATIPFTYFHVVQESDPINLLVFVTAFWALARGKDLALIPLVLVGTLNREATAMIPAVYLLGRFGQTPWRRLAAMTVGLGAAWAVVYGGLLLAYGIRPYYCDVVMIRTNFGSPLPSLYLALLFGALWVVAFLGQRRGPRILARALWLLPPYVVLHYVIALVWEVRLFLPWAPVIIPLAWWVLFPEDRHAQSAEGA